ncbi:MAG: ABC transporter substrate-binding protein [Candidatus Kariarchaeaceae archaeon]
MNYKTIAENPLILHFSFNIICFEGFVLKKISFLFFLLIFIIEICSVCQFPGVEAQEIWENKDVEWYFDNLDDNDRKKIRQAMDYAIPRQEIIDKYHYGLAVPLATNIGQNMIGYDESIQARDHNINQAKTLMAEVFGKKYFHYYQADPNETITITPYFSMTLVAPTSSVTQTQWATVVETNFKEIGIDAELKWWNVNIMIPRIYLEPVGVGFNYANGGVDTWFVGMNSNTDPDFSTEYFMSQFAPIGSNANWIENEEVEEIINRSLTDLNLDDRLKALQEFQRWFHENVPKSIILQEKNFFAVDEKLKGFDTYLVGRGWCFNNYTIANQTQMNYTISGKITNLNPLLSDNFDFIALRNIFGALAQRRGAYNLTHPVPQLAESWTSNTDKTIWEVKLKPNIKWSDGTNLTLDDVLFTYHSVFEDVLNSPIQDLFIQQFENNASDIIKVGNNKIRFIMKKFYPYIESQIFTLPIISQSQWNSIPYSNWKISNLNLGTGSKYPVGCGPYVTTDFDTNRGMKLEINPYFDQNNFGHDPDAIGGGIWFTNPIIDNINIITVRDAMDALEGVSNGTYDIIDWVTGLKGYSRSQWLIQISRLIQDLNAIDNEYHAKFIFALENIFYELNYNHYDPRWGMNPHDPREMMYPPEPVPLWTLPPGIEKFLQTVLFICSLIAAIFVLIFISTKIWEKALWRLP